MNIENTNNILEQIRSFNTKDVFNKTNDENNVANKNPKYINKDMVMQLVGYNETLIKMVRELSIQVEKAEMDILTIGNVLLKNHLVTETELEAESLNLLNKRNEKIRKEIKPITLEDII